MNRDIDFFPNSIYKFAVCGLQYLAVFTYKGSYLSYYNAEIKNPKDLIQLKKMEPGKSDWDETVFILIYSYFTNNTPHNKQQLASEDDDKLIVNYLCLIFIYDAIVTGGADGFVFYLNLVCKSLIALRLELKQYY